MLVRCCFQAVTWSKFKHRGHFSKIERRIQMLQHRSPVTSVARPLPSRSPGPEGQHIRHHASKPFFCFREWWCAFHHQWEAEFRLCLCSEGTDRAAMIPVKGTKCFLHGTSLTLHLAPSVHLRKSCGTSAKTTVIVETWLVFQKCKHWQN